MRSLFYIIILLVIAGCSYSGSQSKELDEAQRLMSSDPAAALSELNGVDVSEFRDSSTMARWALLYSEAMLANNLAAPTDTIINIAVDYYGSHNRKSEFRHASRIKALSAATDNRSELATALYLQKEKEFMLYGERMKREQTVFICIIALMVAAGIIIWMRCRLRIQSARNDALMVEASTLKDCIEARTGDVDRLETTLHGLLENRFALIDTLCQTYYESQGTKTERKAIADKVKSEIEAVRSEAFADMEKAVNDCRDGILVRLKEACPDIKQEDYQLTVYLAGKLSTRSISLLLDESVDVVYKRKSRLKKRLQQTEALRDDDFAAIF